MSNSKVIVEGQVKFRPSRRQWRQSYCSITCNTSGPYNFLHLYLTSTKAGLSRYLSKTDDPSSIVTSNAGSSANPGSVVSSPEGGGFRLKNRSSIGIPISTGSCNAASAAAGCTQSNGSSSSPAPSITTSASSFTAVLSNIAKTVSSHSSQGGFMSQFGAGRSSTDDPNYRTMNLASAAALEASDRVLNTAKQFETKPVDEILGCESGLHFDQEANIIVLLGRNKSYAISLSSLDVMFHWRDTIKRYVEDTEYHVTCVRSSSNKLAVGLQALLHIQDWRMCLVSEPSNGCKFICQWRIESLDKMFVQMPEASAGQPPKLIISANACAKKLRGHYEFEVDPNVLSTLCEKLKHFKNKSLLQPPPPGHPATIAGSASPPDCGLTLDVNEEPIGGKIRQQSFASSPRYSSGNETTSKSIDSSPPIANTVRPPPRATEVLKKLPPVNIHNTTTSSSNSNIPHSSSATNILQRRPSDHQKLSNKTITPISVLTGGANSPTNWSSQQKPRSSLSTHYLISSTTSSSVRNHTAGDIFAADEDLMEVSPLETTTSIDSGRCLKAHSKRMLNNLHACSMDSASSPGNELNTLSHFHRDMSRVLSRLPGHLLNEEPTEAFSPVLASCCTSTQLGVQPALFQWLDCVGSSHRPDPLTSVAASGSLLMLRHENSRPTRGGNGGADGTCWSLSARRKKFIFRRLLSLDGKVDETNSTTTGGGVGGGGLLIEEGLKTQPVTRFSKCFPRWCFTGRLRSKQDLLQLMAQKKTESCHGSCWSLCSIPNSEPCPRSSPLLVKRSPTFSSCSLHGANTVRSLDPFEPTFTAAALQMGSFMRMDKKFLADYSTRLMFMSSSHNKTTAAAAIGDALTKGHNEQVEIAETTKEDASSAILPLRPDISSSSYCSSANFMSCASSPASTDFTSNGNSIGTEFHQPRSHETASTKMSVNSHKSGAGDSGTSQVGTGLRSIRSTLVPYDQDQIRTIEQLYHTCSSCRTYLDKLDNSARCHFPTVPHQYSSLPRSFDRLETGATCSDSGEKPRKPDSMTESRKNSTDLLDLDKIWLYTKDNQNDLYSLLTSKHSAESLKYKKSASGGTSDYSSSANYSTTCSSKSEVVSSGCHSISQPSDNSGLSFQDESSGTVGTSNSHAYVNMTMAGSADTKPQRIALMPNIFRSFSGSLLLNSPASPVEAPDTVDAGVPSLLKAYTNAGIEMLMAQQTGSGRSSKVIGQVLTQSFAPDDSRVALVSCGRITSVKKDEQAEFSPEAMNADISRNYAQVDLRPSPSTSNQPGPCLVLRDSTGTSPRDSSESTLTNFKHVSSSSPRYENSGSTLTSLPAGAGTTVNKEDSVDGTLTNSKVFVKTGSGMHASYSGRRHSQSTSSVSSMTNYGSLPKSSRQHHGLGKPDLDYAQFTTGISKKPASGTTPRPPLSMMVDLSKINGVAPPEASVAYVQVDQEKTQALANALNGNDSTISSNDTIIGKNPLSKLRAGVGLSSPVYGK